MGYTTDFNGSLELTPPANEELTTFINAWKNTRRMKRDVSKLNEMFEGRKGLKGNYGVDGEFFIGEGSFGQDRDDSVLEYNAPPSTQPGLWCQWELSEDGKYLEWDEGEKFYNYVEWLEYMIANFFEPNDIKLNGDIEWFGEESDDRGIIRVTDNKIKIGEFKATFDFEE